MFSWKNYFTERSSLLQDTIENGYKSLKSLGLHIWTSIPEHLKAIFSCFYFFNLYIYRYFTAS